MADFLHCWTPLRAQLAFGDRAARVSSLDNGWFKSLKRGDVLWVMSRTGDELVLVLRGEAARDARPIRTIPRYAVGNSEVFSHYRVSFTERSKSLPFSAPLSFAALKRLQFEGRSVRVNGALNNILVGPLASMRRLKEAAVPILEQAWSQRINHPWKDLNRQGLGLSTAVDVESPREKKRIEAVVTRVVRDTSIVTKLKALHRHRCQICGTRLRLGKAKHYSEGHHLRPLGGIHDGPDAADNILIVCPNHHAQLDFAAVEIAKNKLRQQRGHTINEEHISYHNRLVRKSRA